MGLFARINFLVSCLVACLSSAILPLASAAEAGGLAWISPNRFRVVLTVDPQGVKRSHSPATVDIDLPGALAASNAAGRFDQHTIEVVAYDSAGKPRVYDASRGGDERFLLPWRIEEYYGINRVTLHFVVPDETCTRCAVYFDTVESGRGKPQRYAGLVGDGDWFTEGFKRRAIAATKMDAFCDLDRDGDLDLFKITTEPFIYCYENVGGGRFVDRGRMASGGELFVLPHDGFHRSWATLAFDDWDNDGDQDLFVGFSTGSSDKYRNQFVAYENTTASGGPLTFAERGPLRTVNGNPLGSPWFATLKAVDFDGDGKKDVLASSQVAQTEGRRYESHNLKFFKGNGGEPWKLEFAEGIALQADGKDIEVHSPNVECADLDGDGDVEVFTAGQGADVLMFENTGTRTRPALAKGRILPHGDKPLSGTGVGHSGIAVADFDGDGLLDCLVGHLWYSEPSQRALYKNVGTRTEPRFAERDADHGAPYTEQFQPCYVGRQNVVRAADWDNDGNTDLVASKTSNSVAVFRNTNNQLFSVFTPAETILGKVEGVGRIDVCDWNSDGKKDLLSASMTGQLTLFLNQGTDARPAFGAGKPVSANGKPIDGTLWSNVLVCDWDNDGKKDVIFGMGGGGDTSAHYDWPHLNPDAPSRDTGFLFYKNQGTDAEPVLAYPKWVKAGDQVISYTRPNVGSCIDWDGDGKKDFIACEFENIIRFYKNVGSGAAGSEPEFESVEGITIVKPWTAMLVSGAHALDWNRDGDVDIVTGQGHGGDGLRFFERDWIEDSLNGKYPKVTAGDPETAPTRSAG